MKTLPTDLKTKQTKLTAVAKNIFPQLHNTAMHPLNPYEVLKNSLTRDLKNDNIKVDENNLEERKISDQQENEDEAYSDHEA